MLVSLDMQVIYPGHAYQLAHHDGVHVETLQFVQKVMDGEHLRVEVAGTTNEEVIAVLIDRMEYLQEQVPCAENEEVLMHLRRSLQILNARTKDRMDRNVEETNQK